MAKKINVANIAAGLDSVQAVIDNLHMVGRQESVPAACIRMNPRNSARAKDTDEEIAELAAGIQASGLIHPLAVNKVSDTEYRLMSGERRYRAITTYLHWDTIPCMVYEGLSPDEELCVLITANMQTRRYTPEDRLMLYEQLDTALRHMRDAGEYKGGLQKGIADLMGVSERQIRTYKAALENVRQQPPVNPASASPSPAPEEIPAQGKTKINLTETAKKHPKENPLNIPVWKKRAEEALLSHYSQEELKRIFCIQLLPPREAAKALKPSGGYAGGTIVYSDKTWGDCTTDSKGITIQYGPETITLTYSQAEALLRRTMAEKAEVTSALGDEGTYKREKTPKPVPVPEPENNFATEFHVNWIEYHLNLLLQQYPADTEERETLSQAQTAIAQFIKTVGLGNEA